MANRTVNRPTRTRGRERAHVESALDALDDIVYLFDEEGILWWNRALEDTTGYEADEIAEFDHEDLVAQPRREPISEPPGDVANGEGQTLVLDLVTKDGERIPHEFHSTTWVDDATGDTYRCSIARDIRERRSQERALERRRAELAILGRINEVLLELTRDLFESSTRIEVERAVCDRLAGSELYRFAWIGTPDADEHRIVPRSSAGIDEDAIDTVAATTTDPDARRDPAVRAFETGELQVSHDVRADPTFESWRDAAREYGVRSAVAVPLSYDETIYGVLAVYATRPLAFSGRELDGFEILGEAVGFAINAVNARNVLFADTVVELEVGITDPGLVFIRAAQQLACELTVTGCVGSASSAWSVYLTVDGATPSAVREIAADDPEVERVQIVAEEDDAGVLEFVMKGSTVNEITKHGAVLTSGYVDAGRGRFRFEAARTADIRRLSDRLRAAYPGSTVIAQREFDRPVQKAVEFRQSIEDRLTDRQREALERAYHAGYFDWPRRCTADAIAASMGVAATTFHYHLRNALDTLSTVLIEQEDR